METPLSPDRLAVHIKAECVRRGWDLSDLARRAGISRTTLYHLLEGRTERPHAATLARLSEALELPVESLLAEREVRDDVSGTTVPTEPDPRVRLDRATNPHIEAIARERPGLFSAWAPEDWDELYSSFGTGGALTRHGVVVAAESINRKRETIRRLHLVLETHLRVVAEELVDTLYRMVRPQGLLTPAAIPPPSPENIPDPEAARDDDAPSN